MICHIPKQAREPLSIQEAYLKSLQNSFQWIRFHPMNFADAKHRVSDLSISDVNLFSGE